jgi:hypothetical protein
VQQEPSTLAPWLVWPIVAITPGLARVRIPAWLVALYMLGAALLVCVAVYASSHANSASANTSQDQLRNQSSRARTIRRWEVGSARFPVTVSGALTLSRDLAHGTLPDTDRTMIVALWWPGAECHADGAP